MKRITHFAMAVVIFLFSCTSNENPGKTSELKPILMTDGIALTRSGIQETRLVEGETVYVWANQRQTSNNGVTWTTDWTKDAYLKAWTLEADGTINDANAYNVLIGNTKYYPPKPLAMVAIHGNFANAFTEDETAIPSSVTHTVESDQNVTGNYEKSDLLWWKSDNITISDDPVHVTFAHKLSKVEITLSDDDFTEDELNQATVTLNNVKPTVTLNMADGTLGSASGTPVFITPRKIGKCRFEAVIPPQTKPTNFISVKMNGATVVVDAQTTFSSNERYVYALTVKKANDIRRNPLWYMAEYNLNTNGTFNTTLSTSQGGYFTWAEAMATSLGVAAQTSSYDGWVAVGKTINDIKYHLPTHMEMVSIIPFVKGETNEGVFSNKPTAKTIITENACTFGYDNTTKYSNKTNNTSNVGIQYKSYWSSYTSGSGVRYAIRFIGTNYCSVWRYKSLGRGTTSARLEISSRLIDKIEASETSKLSSIIDELPSKSDSYWATDEMSGVVNRVMYSTGYSNTAKDRGHYWGATEYSSGLAYRFCWFDTNISSGSADLNLYPYDKSYLFTIRLFRDE